MKKVLFCFYAAFLISLWTTGEAAETVKVAAVMVKTGDAIQQIEGRATPALIGVRYAIDDINKQGGLLGKQIELLEFDNKSSAIGARIAAEKAVKSGIVAILGDIWSSHSLAVAPIAQAAKIPMITPISTNPKVTLAGDYIFRVCFIDTFQGLAMANFAIDDLKVKTAVVLTNTSKAYSIGLVKVFKEQFIQKGGEILWEGDFLSKTSNFTKLLETVKEYNPDVIYIPAPVRESSYIIRQAREMGITSILLGSDAWFDALLTYAGDAVEGSYYSTHWHPDASNALSQKFIKDHHYTSTKHGTPLGYDAAMLLMDAIRRANSFEPTKIRDALAATKNFKGLTGTISLDYNGDPIKSVIILKFENNKIIYHKTIEPNHPL